MKHNRRATYHFEDKRRKGKNTALFVIAFVCFSIVLSAVSLLMLWRSYDYDFGNIVKTPQTSQTDTTAPVTQPVQLTGSASILLVHTSEDSKQLRAVNAVMVELSSGTIKIVPFTADTKTAGGETLEESFLASGMKGLTAAVSSIDGCVCDKYVNITDSALINIIKYLGDLQYTLSSPVSYVTEELAIELPAGEQLLSPETVLKLVKYNNAVYSSEEASQRNAVLLAAAVNKYYTADIAGKSTELYTQLINYVQSDISVVDFQNARARLEAFAQSDTRNIAFVADGNNG